MTVMPSSSDVADKAVSTEDASCGVEVASIDALLAALVETKVEAMKASSSTMTRRFGSAPASPRRPWFTSSSTVSSSQNHHYLHHCHGDHHHGEHHHGYHLEHLSEHSHDHYGKHPEDLQEELEDQGSHDIDHCRDYQDKNHHHHREGHRHGRKYEKKKGDRRRRHGSAPCGEFIENPKLYEHHAHRSEKEKRRGSECPRSPRKKRRHSKSHHILQEDILDLPLGLDAPFELLGIDGDQDLGLINLSRSREAFSDISEYPRLHQSACYTSQSEAQLKIHYDEDDDFLALNLEDELDDDETLSSPEKVDVPVEKFHRPRKKRKRRRKVEPEIVEIEKEFIDPDDLPPRARLTIIATACLLLVMSLLLVGITLRMAPIIDEMVRKENEALLNSLNQDSSIFENTTEPSFE
ncbi:uncharacterized protein LOC117171043 [Belonocnema kinseyi]|uniref:uncharacterized protein LOC117171043 n=1 Tax=Belonocnema kinseyi TaxID=2817044 RepID=UPI00143D8ED9|nr:uncharacterized protein LOC117171043 [Belonocnema kinseyi]